ncbi:NUDIX hydrolase [Mumia sp. zg.B17]|uniref:NUDIX domain-containing protein n=1 Tax=Mumia sp. zg.B17 TaxID=2855446 RepID=UPI001C6F4F6B|nr:NUDIX hydrolase [Mumia sp. zg.B17]MBW9204939.1 NUDIX hydrolase [Mumia sp. zg.B17]
MSAATRVAHPTLPGFLLAPGEQLEDRAESWQVRSSETPYASAFVDVVLDQVETPEGGTINRTTVRHDDAVGVVALDDQGRVLLLEQYRHPVRERLVELPAGLLDIEGESAADAAARELAEETDLVASEWSHLVTLRSSPGFTDERVEVYLAQGLEAVADDARTERLDEEADMTSVWVPLGDAVAAVLDGRITNALAVAGLLAGQVRAHGDTSA